MRPDHGLGRRQLLRAGLAVSLVGVAPVAALAADRLELVELRTAQGRRVEARMATAAVAVAPAVLLVHDAQGLGDHALASARMLADAGYHALAIDLFAGRTAAAAGQAMADALDPGEATDMLASWMRWLVAHPSSTGRIAVVGWGLGGGWALNASLIRPVDATIVFYGDVAKPADQLAPLGGPLQGHFAARDSRTSSATVDRFAAAMRAAGKAAELHRYSADAGFADPASPTFDPISAKLAWTRSQAFLRLALFG